MCLELNHTFCPRVKMWRRFVSFKGFFHYSLFKAQSRFSIFASFAEMLKAIVQGVGGPIGIVKSGR